MNYSSYRFTLDIHQTRSQLSIPVMHKDTSVRFYISLIDGSAVYCIAEGCTAKLIMRRGDESLGTKETIIRDCIIEDGRVVFTFDDDTASVCGVAACEVRLYGKNGGLLTAPRFSMLVDERVISDDEAEEADKKDASEDQMTYSKYRFTLDIHKSKSQVFIPVMFGDTSIRFYMSINDGGVPYTIAEGCTAMFCARKANGRLLVHKCDINDGRIVYTFRDTTANVLGVTNCEVRIYGAGGAGLLTTPRFFMVVEEKVMTDDEVKEEYEEVSSDLSGLDEIILNEQKRKVNEAEREENEESRRISEAERADSEFERKEAEAKRDDAEGKRADAEGARATSENERAAEEKKRIELYQELLQAKENGDFNGVSVTHKWDGTYLVITSASGTTSADLKGERGERGERGEGFSIAKTYKSISDMNGDFSNSAIPLYSFVLIDTGDVEDPDNAKLYVKLEEGYSYLTDLSGSQGIRGEKGDDGITPRMRINADTNFWEISYDSGKSWTSLGVRATGDQGEQGIQGIQGIQGEKGIFVGTQTEYDEAYEAGEITVGMLVVILDDETTASAVLGRAILGKMILGRA